MSRVRPWDDIAKFMEMPANPADEIMVLPYGTWSHRWYGEIAIDDRDGQECVTNFDDDVAGQRIPIEFADHMSSDLGAAGWYTSLRAGTDGVYATIDWTPKGLEAISEARFIYHSPEVYLRCLGQKYVRSSDRRVYSNLITGDSVTNHPFFKELGPISDAQFSERVQSELSDGPMIFRVPIVTARGEEESDDMAIFNRKPTSEKPGEEQVEGTVPEGDFAAQFAAMQQQMETMQASLDAVTAENVKLSEGRQADREQLSATQAELARKQIADQLGALRFSAGKQVLAPAHVQRCAAFMSKLSGEAASFRAAEGEAAAQSMQAEFVEIISALPTGLVEFGERGFTADPEQLLDANARYEAEVQKLMGAGKELSRSAAMERVNAAQPELAKAAGLG